MARRTAAGSGAMYDAGADTRKDELYSSRMRHSQVEQMQFVQAMAGAGSASEVSAALNENEAFLRLSYDMLNRLNSAVVMGK